MRLVNLVLAGLACLSIEGCGGEARDVEADASTTADGASPHGGDANAPAHDGSADTAPPVNEDAAPSRDASVEDVARPSDGATEASGAGCGPGTVFCNSSCGICLLASVQCHVDSCGNGSAGESCGSVRCGAGTRCVGGIQCVPQ